MRLTFSGAGKFLRKALVWIGVPAIVAMLVALLTFQPDVIRITGILVVSVFAVYGIFVALFFAYTLLLFLVKLLVPSVVVAAIFAAVLLAAAIFVPQFLGGPVYSLEELVSPLVEKVSGLLG